MAPINQNIDLTGQGFAARLHALRTRAGLTKSELADKAGVSYRTVHDLERGQRHRVHAGHPGRRTFPGRVGGCHQLPPYPGVRFRPGPSGDTRFSRTLHALLHVLRLADVRPKIYFSSAGITRIPCGVGYGPKPEKPICILDLDVNLNPGSLVMADSFLADLPEIYPDSLIAGTGPGDPHWMQNGLGGAVHFQAGH